ncbi:hypothetical protein Bbelb_062350 [Branchiostoma belcheri]|nr:hypothetical protein Bbelb_062350 [Branchiostoma belcheri]
MENSSVENVASSLVREYLSRKGLKGTLQTMDSEMPRTEGSISNRLQLAKELHLEYLMKKNKECSPPLRAMLEVMTKYFLQKLDAGREDKRPSSRHSSRVTSDGPSSRSASHSKPPSDDSGFHSNQSNHHAKRTPKVAAHDLDIRVEEEEGLGSTAISDVSKSGVHSNVEESPVKLKKETSSKMATPESKDSVETMQTKKSRPGSSRGLRSGMMAGPIMSSQDTPSSELLSGVLQLAAIYRQCSERVAVNKEKSVTTMVQNKALLYFLLLVSNQLLLVSAPALQCPDSCSSYSVNLLGRKRVSCRCPDKNWVGSPCSWIGYGGTYSFPACLDAIPTNFVKATSSIFIKHLRSSTISERSFPNSLEVQYLWIQQSNVSTVQPGAFQGLPLVEDLALNDNRISNLEPDTFLGLEKVQNLNLQRNAISVISQHALRGLLLLERLRLSKNRLRSVPVDALLPLPALKFADLVTNHITTIDSQVLRLRHNQTFRLMLTDNQLKCDANLTWFICHLPELHHIFGRDILRCGSPANLSGILLATVRKDIVGQTNTGWSPQDIRSGRCDETSTIPTDMPHTNTTPGSEYLATTSQATTGADIIVTPPSFGPILPKEDDSYHVSAVIMAVAVPLLMVLAWVVAIYLYERCQDTGLAPHNAPAEPDGNSAPSDRDSVTGRQPSPAQDQTSEGNDDIEPYAVSYMDVSGKGKNGKLFPYATTSFANIQPREPDNDDMQTIEDTDDIEPYAVSYMDVSGKGKNGKLFPYATTSFANFQPREPDNDDVQTIENSSDDIEPYAVSYMDVSGKGKNGKLFPYATTLINEDPGPQLQPYSVTLNEDPGPQLQPYSVTLNEDPGPQLQPYSVTHDEDPGPQLQPYAVTHDEDPGPQLQPYSVTHDEDPGPQLQPYAVTLDEDPSQATRSHTKAEGQSLPEDVSIKPNYERGCPTTRDSRGPYGIDEGQEVPSVSGALYRSGSQHTEPNIKKRPGALNSTQLGNKPGDRKQTGLDRRRQFFHQIFREQRSEKSPYVAKDPAKKILTEEETYLDSKRTASASKLIKSTSLDERIVSPNGGTRTKTQDTRRKSAEPESLAAKLDGKISPPPSSLSQKHKSSPNPSEILTDISQDTLTEQLAARREARAKTRPKTAENGASRMDRLKERLKSVEDSFDDNGTNNSKSRKSTSSTTKKFGDIEMGDVDDLEDDFGDLALSAPAPSIKPLADAQPITAETATELKTLLFGSASEQFNAEWRNQSLSFCDTEGLRFGIVQNKGGPCGALAAIQACMLKRLLFGEARDKTANPHRLLSPDSRLRSECLALGLADLLWRAGRKKLAVVAMPSGRKQFQAGARYRQDNLTETLMLNRVDSQEDLEAFIKQNVSLFETNPYATILVLYSAILSRTIDHVISDMDEPTTKFIGAHGYCTQEMVNLFLTGKAVSNVFNDTVELDSGGGETMILRGVGTRSEIGLLSLFEHYGSCQVGTYMKTPRFPIWVVCSESHFSVLFCLRKELVNDWKYERRFDLYYYDGLARQDEQIRLTVDNLHPYEPPGEGELVPPLEHCIRTK